MALSFSEFVQRNRNNILRDIKRLVDIKSVKSKARPGAPYGDGVRAAELEALKLCAENGLQTADLDGHIAYAHYGDPDRFIAIVAHLDVVPEGGGWDTPPYDMTERDGYIVGRGVADDKGPFVLGLYAVKYLIEENLPLRYGIRLILGLDEECGMSDLDYYNAHCAAPVFAFTPDSDFPVGHGEKGIYSADLVSPEIADGVIRSIAGGVASNVVPDNAAAELCPEHATALEQAAAGREDITVTAQPGSVRVEARGIARHAGEPEGGVNAIHTLLRFLLDSGVLSDAEKDAVEFMIRVGGGTDGQFFGIACDDGLFTPLTLINGRVALKDRRFVLNINSRYPTAIEPQELEKRIESTAAQYGFTVADVENSAPFYLDPGYPAVQMLCDIYNEITGQDEKPYVMSGGTYARKMKNAVAYGIDAPRPENPGWVGKAHMKNEAVSIDHALQACEIFINTLVRLQDIAL